MNYAAGTVKYVPCSSVTKEPFVFGVGTMSSPFVGAIASTITPGTNSSPTTNCERISWLIAFMVPVLVTFETLKVRAAPLPRIADAIIANVPGVWL